jgi:hypothetical protein
MKTKMMNYNEAMVYLKPLGLKNKEEYDAWWNANKPDFLPQFPEEYYSKMPKEESETSCKNSTIRNSHIRYIEKQPMELINEYIGEMKCKVCGAIHLASIKPRSNGRFYRGAWQCQNGCKI